MWIMGGVTIYVYTHEYQLKLSSLTATQFFLILKSLRLSPPTTQRKGRGLGGRGHVAMYERRD